MVDSKPVRYAAMKIFWIQQLFFMSAQFCIDNETAAKLRSIWPLSFFWVILSDLKLMSVCQSISPYLSEQSLSMYMDTFVLNRLLFVGSI